MADDKDRKSIPLEPDLITDEEQRARAEVTNALRQFDRVQELVDLWITSDQRRRLRVSVILDLQRHAVEGANAFAGVYRASGVEIGGSRHRPPSAYLVPGLVDNICDYVN